MKTIPTRSAKLFQHHKATILGLAGAASVMFGVGQTHAANTTAVPFVASGTWTCPAGVTSVQVECWGGGGAGGSACRPGSTTATGGGGAGGAYAKTNSLAVTPGTVYTVTVGAGGVSVTNDTQRVSGGDSWFGSAAIVLAKGGQGGESVFAATGRFGGGGVGSTTGCIGGSAQFAGGSGATSTTANFGGAGGGSAGTTGPGTAASTTTGVGATAVTGGGNGGNANPTSGSSGGGQTPTTPPGGGGGGARSSSATQQFGGPGASGQVILTYAVPGAIYRADTAGNLNTTGDWTGGVVPASTNFAAWDSTVATPANCTNALGGDLSWHGISIGTPSAAVNISSGNTLTLGATYDFANGIDMTAAGQNLTLNCGVTVAPGDQKWKVIAGKTLDASAVSINRSLGGTVDFSGTGAIKIGNANATGIVGGWATVDGAGWATNGTAGIAPLATYVAGNGVATTDNLDETGAGSTSIAGCNSIRFSLNGSSFKINQNGSPQVIASGGVLVRNGVSATFLSSSGAGSLREMRGSSGGDLILNVVGSGSLKIGGASVGNSAIENGPVTISDNTTATGLTKSGAGTATLYGFGTYSGNTRINQGTLALASFNVGASLSTLSGTTNIYIESGATFDVTANTNTSFVSGFTVGLSSTNGQRLEGLGTVNGNLTIASGSTNMLYPGTHGLVPAYGTLTIKSNLTIGALSKVEFDLNSSTSSGNDKIVLDAATGTLNGNGATITINQINGNNTLATGDYVLFDLTGASGSVASSFATTPAWVQTPANAANYNIITVGKQVSLHYTAPASAANSTAVASPTSGVTADGVTTSTITVTARDGSGNIISNANVTATSSGTGNTISTAAITGVNGQTTFTIKSTVAETKTIIVTIAGTAITQQPTVVFVPGAVSATNSTAVASPTGGITADGSSTSTITITAKDANNNLISGATVSASATGTGNTLSSPANTGVNGQSAYTIASTVAETKTNTIIIAGTPITVQPTVGFVPGAVSAANSTAVASPTTVSSDGVSVSTITVTAKDANNNLISGATVSASSTGSGNTLSSPANTGGNGQTTFTIASTVPEVKTITVTINSTTITQQPVVTFQVSVSPSLTTVSASPTNGLTADNTATSTVTVTAVDVGSNPIPGATVVVTSSGTGNTISTPAVTDGSGVTTATIRTTKAETKTISVTVNGTAITQQAFVTFDPGAVSATNSTISPATATKVADGSSTQVVTVQARDIFNNNRTTGGDTVVFSATSGTVGSTTDNGDGTYSATWTSPTSVGSGTATVTATLGGTAVGTAVGASSSVITLAPGAGTQVRVETAANGSGSVLGAQTLFSGASTTVYAIVRDANNNFVTNEAATAWSLTGNTGGVVAADLVPSGDSKSATFSAHVAGTATIHVTSGALTAGNSGLQTVVQPYYKTATSGQWGVTSTWLWSDTLGGTYTAAASTPNSTNTLGVTILSSHNVTVSNSVTVDLVTVTTGGTLTVAGGKTLTVALSAGTDLDVFGTVVNAGTIATTANPVIVFEAASLYQHNQTTGVIPTATWNLTSTCEVNGVTTSTSGPTGLGQSFGNFRWSCTNQSVTCNINGGLTTVNGDFIVATTGAGILRGAGSSGVTMNIGGSLRVQAGIYELGNNNPTATIYNITNDIVVSSGARLDFKNAGTSGGNFTINLLGNLTVSGTGVLARGATATCALNFIKAGTQVVAIDPAASTIGAINWTVSGNTTLDLGTSIIAGTSATFTTSAGSTLKIGHPQGISNTSGTGNIQVTGSKTFDGAGSYFYTGTAAQDTGTALPTTTGNVKILNAGGIVTLHSSAIVNTPGKFTVATGAYLQFSSDSVQGTGEFVLEAGGTIGIDNAGGLRALPNITGGVVRTATKTYDPAANYVFNNSPSAQSMGDGFPGTVNNLTISNTAFTVSMSTNVQVNGTFAVNSGATLDFNSKTITTPNAPVLSGALTMEVAKTGPNTFTGSKLTQSSGTIAYGGTLSATNTGTALASGDSIPLFSAPAYSGGFSAVTGLTPAGLTRDATQLTAGTGGNVTFTCDGTLAAGAAANTAICSGDSYSLNGSASGGGGAYDYSWVSSPSGFTSSSANPSVSPTVTTTYTLTVTDANGCTAPASVTVTVNPLPTTSAITGTNSVQQLATATYSVANTAGSTYGWVVPAGASFTGGTGNSINVTFGSTSGNVSVIETNATGCTGSQQSLFVNVITCTAPAIVGGIDPGTTNVIAFNPVVFALTNVTGTAPLYYQWRSNDVDIASATNSSYTNLSVTVADAGNYVCVVVGDCGSVTSSVAILTVSKATPTATLAVNNSPQTYDGTGKAATVTIPASSVPGSVANIITGGASSQTNAGTYAVTADFVPNDTANYNTLTAQSAGSFVIQPAAASVTANAQSKTYGDVNPALTATVVGTVNGDILNYTLATDAAQFSSVGVSNITVTLGSNPNYSVLATNSTLTIGARAASVTADAKSKTYGDVNPTLTATEAGTVNGDLLSYTLATDAAQFSNVGVSNITVSLGSNPNYSVLTTNNTLTISAKSASVTANNASKNYGQTVAFAGTEFTSSGLVGGDAVISVSLTSSGATSSASVGTYPIVASAAIGTGLGNYTLSYTNGTLTVNAATPVIVNSPVQLLDGNFQLTFTGGDDGVSYQIQASSDLSSPVWSVLSTNVATMSGIPSFTDLDATNHPIRFYRTVVP